MTHKNLGPEEAAKLDAIEALVNSLRSEAGQAPEPFASVAADKVARIVGSWKFLLGQAGMLFLYICANAWLLSTDAFDPYPFILLNLCLSFQAAFTAPIILMAQNRTDAKDRKHATRAYKTIGHIEELVKLLASMQETTPEPAPQEDQSQLETRSEEKGSS
jgi:uncharacterized membrane protein